MTLLYVCTNVIFSITIEFSIVFFQLDSSIEFSNFINQLESPSRGWKHTTHNDKHRFCFLVGGGDFVDGGDFGSSRTPGRRRGRW